jgi:lysophospholipase L1-like esterase
MIVRLPAGFIRLALVLALCAFDHVFAAPDKWKAEIDKFTEADVAQPPPSHAVLFIGSSSIRKWTSLAKDFPDVRVINRGFGGSELSDSVFYADRIAIPYRPRLIVVYAGDNDLARGRTAGEVHAEFRKFCAKVHAALPQTRILYVSIKPSPSREKLKDQVIAANALIADECRKDQRLGYADVYTPMLDAKGAMRPELYVEDMLHMNGAGYAIWTRVIAPLLR